MSETSSTAARPLAWGIGLAGLFLAVGIGLGAVILGQSLVEMRQGGRVVTVKGLAEREVEADVASWRLPFRGVAETREAAIREASAARDTVTAFALAGGLEGEELSIEPFTLNIERVFVNVPGGQEERERYIAKAALRLRTGNVDALEKLSGQTQLLLDRGVLLGEGDYGQTPQAEYGFSGINEIKPGMIAEATRSAREAAQRFAEDSGSRVGKIVSANQGVVQFLARDGNYDERYERHKIIRVVSTVNYRLVD